MRTALELSGVTKRYGDFAAVSDLSFAVPRGTICGFLGPNGAGKTSTVRMILGLTSPSEGGIDVLGADDGRKVRDRIGFLPEERGLYRKMSPLDIAVYLSGLKGMNPRDSRPRAKAMLEAQGLGAFMRQPMKALSKGMAQKVQLVCALVHRPELVILDEPFSGLDPVNQEGLESVIRDLAHQGATVLFSTHVMQHAERLCQQVVLMARGRKVFDGTLEAARDTAPRYLEIEGRLDPAAVTALPGVGAVEIVTPGEVPVLRATLTRGAEAQVALKAAFLGGLDVRRFEMRQPSLHDAFIVLTGQDWEAGR